MAIWLGDYGAHEIHRRDMDSVVVEVREVVGESLVYFAFDIDAIGPSCSPGTGVSEIRGGEEGDARLTWAGGKSFLGGAG